MYQYFIEVVPTTFTTRLRTINTYQYAVTEQASFTWGEKGTMFNKTGPNVNAFYHLRRGQSIM